MGICLLFKLHSFQWDFSQRLWLSHAHRLRSMNCRRPLHTHTHTCAYNLLSAYGLWLCCSRYGTNGPSVYRQKEESGMWVREVCEQVSGSGQKVHLYPALCQQSQRWQLSLTHVLRQPLSSHHPFQPADTRCQTDPTSPLQALLTRQTRPTRASTAGPTAPSSAFSRKKK